MLLQHTSRWMLLGGASSDFESGIYPSAFRMRAFASLTISFSVMMTLLYYFGPAGMGNGPGLNILLIATATLLLVQTYRPFIPYFSSAELYALLAWGTLSFCSVWLYCIDQYSHFQFTGLVLTTTTYFLITPTRLAILGTLGSMLLTATFAWWLEKHFAPPPSSQLLTMGLVYIGSVIFSLNNRSLRHQRLNQTRALVRHMQRSLEPGLQGMNTLVPQLQQAASLLGQGDTADRIERIAKRLRRSTLSMQDYLELQSINAQFLALNTAQKMLSADQVVREAVTAHPFMTSSSQNAVTLRLVHDFYFLGSKQEWLHMLRNILQNAIQALYAEKQLLSPGDIIITISCTPMQGIIAVRDRGKGMQAINLQQIFHPFYTIGQNAGIGLGLSYCKQVVATSGGVIKVVSRPEKGTRFDITLPKVQESA